MQQYKFLARPLQNVAFFAKYVGICRHDEMKSELWFDHLQPPFLRLWWQTYEIRVANLFLFNLRNGLKHVTSTEIHCSKEVWSGGINPELGASLDAMMKARFRQNCQELGEVVSKSMKTDA